jgi:uncharacterized protein (TIGR02246 family)
MVATNVKSAIRELNAGFDAAFNRGDGATLAALYTPNAVLMPPGAEMQKGRAAIKSFWEGMMQEFGGLHLMTVDLKQYGEDTLREIGRLTVHTKAAPQTQLAGKYVVVWEKVRGKWKLATDIANFDSDA